MLVADFNPSYVCQYMPMSAKPIKLFFTLFFIQLISFSHSFADDTNAIGITAEKTFIEVSHNGKTVKIEREQIHGKNIKTKPCPPFCIKPLTLSPNVETFAELELISFLSNDVKNEKGFLVDSRMTDQFEKETIPGAINIPFLLFTGSQAKAALKLLGAKEENPSNDFSEAKTMCFFCDDSLCDESNRAISALISLGYPANRLKYYRGGIQAWKALNLTTISSDPEQQPSNTAKTN